MRRLAAVLASALLLAATAHAAGNPAFGVSELLQGFAGVTEARARFVEIKHYAHLDEPIRVEGTLIYQAPDRLEKHITRPLHERLIAHGETVAVEREIEDGRYARRELALDDLPALRPLILSLRATLAGDRESLERYYQLALSGDPQDWTLTLTPRDSSLRQIVRRIRLRGRAAQITTIDIVEASGDRSRTTLSPLTD